MTAVTDAAWIGLIPFLSMGGASLLLGKFPPSKKVEAFFQYLTAGLLIAIVGVHLLPDIFDREIASRKDSLVGVSIGLIFAWLFLAAVAHINDLLENKDPTSATDFELPKKEAKTEGGIVVESQHKKLLKGGEVIPLNLELSVIMNAVVDGFLIGLGIAEDKSGGILIAAGLSVEMALLGISLTAKVMSCTGSPIGMRLIAIMIPPFLLYIFCLIGAAAGEAARNTPIIFISIVMFGIGVLTSLSAFELLEYAQQNMGSNKSINFATFAFFIGVYIPIFIQIVAY